MVYNVYSTTQLNGFYNVIDKVKPFLFDTFFSTTQLFDTQTVTIDVGQRARRLAPLADPLKQGNADILPNYNSVQYTPAYVKTRLAIDPIKVLARRHGESFAPEFTPEQRRDLLVMETMRLQDEEVSRREELMAAQALISGLVTIKANGDQVSMYRPAANTVNLHGSASAWGQAGIDPLQNLNSWSAAVQKVSGYVPRIVVMDPLAFNLFLHSPGITEIMTSFNQQSGYVNLAGYPVGGIGNEASFVGVVGQYEIWTYQSFYTDDTGAVQQMLPDNTVIMGDPVGAGGRRLYGAILDNASLVPTPRFFKNYYDQESGYAFVSTQSSPLVTMGWSQATLCATVA